MINRIGAEKTRKDTNIVIKNKIVFTPLTTLFSLKNPISVIVLFLFYLKEKYEESRNFINGKLRKLREKFK